MDAKSKLEENYSKAFPKPEVNLSVDVNDVCSREPMPQCQSGCGPIKLDVSLGEVDLSPLTKIPNC